MSLVQRIHLCRARPGGNGMFSGMRGQARRALLPGTLPKRPDRHLDRRAPQQVRPDPRQLLEQARALPGSLHPVPRKKPVQMRRPRTQSSHENWPTRRSGHAQWPDPTRPDSQVRDSEQVIGRELSSDIEHSSLSINVARLGSSVTTVSSLRDRRLNRWIAKLPEGSASQRD